MLGDRANLAINFGKCAAYTGQVTDRKKMAQRELAKKKFFICVIDVKDARTGKVVSPHLWLAIPIKLKDQIRPNDTISFRGRVSEYRKSTVIRYGLRGIQEVKVIGRTLGTNEHTKTDSAEEGKGLEDAAQHCICGTRQQVGQSFPDR